MLTATRSWGLPWRLWFQTQRLCNFSYTTGNDLIQTVPENSVSVFKNAIDIHERSEVLRGEKTSLLLRFCHSCGIQSLRFQLIRYARRCSNYSDFLPRHRALVARLLSEGYKVNCLSNKFEKFHGRHTDIVGQYKKNVCQMFTDSVS